MSARPAVGTTAYRAFEHNISQAFLLADVIRRGGLLLAEKVLATGNDLTRAVAGVDMATVAAMPEASKSRLDQAASSVDEAAMQRVVQEAEEFERLANDTAPQVLLAYMAAAFEAYLGDLALLICYTEPTFATATERGLASVKGDGQPRSPAMIQDIGGRVRNLFREGRWDRIGLGLFEQGLALPFTAVCARAKTTPHELDRAKALRNLHIHNRGMIDRAFIKRVGDLTLRVGDYHPVTADYLVAMKDKVFFVVLGLDLVAVDAYPTIVS